jgi:RNA polymerase sigma factor (sigma-70 family)
MLTMSKHPDPLIPTRRSLLSKLKNWDDHQSWQEFFDTYWKLIYGVAIKAGLTDAEAQEVVQDTVIVVAKQMQEFKYDPTLGTFKSWLLHTTRWKIADQFRKRLPTWNDTPTEPWTSKRTASIERIPDPAVPELEALWEEEWAGNILEVALNRVRRHVKPRQFQIFDLYVVKKWPVQKVAQTLSVNIGQVYLAKHRISRLVQKEIKSLSGNLL